MSRVATCTDVGLDVKVSADLSDCRWARTAQGCGVGVRRGWAERRRLLAEVAEVRLRRPMLYRVPLVLMNVTIVREYLRAVAS